MKSLKFPSQYFLATSLTLFLTGVTCVHEVGVWLQSVCVRGWASRLRVPRVVYQGRSLSFVPLGVGYGCIVLNVLVSEHVVRLYFV